MTKFHRFYGNFPDIIFSQSPVGLSMQFYKMQAFGALEVITEIPVKHLKGSNSYPWAII